MSARDRGKTKKTLLIVGKAGNGKSSTGNTILGSLKFEVAHSFTSCDHSSQIRGGEDIRVVCAADLQHKKFCGSEVEEEKEVQSWLEDSPDALIWVIRCDQRFTEEEINVIRKLKKSRFPEMRELIEKKLVIVFTMGDRLYGRDIRLDIETVNGEDGPLQEIWKEAQKRYVIFDNKTKGSRRETQVKALLEIVETMVPYAFPQHVCRLLFVGTEKSLQKVQKNLGIRTNFFGPRVTMFDHIDVKGLDVEMTFYCTDVDNYPRTLEKIKVAVSPGPHAIYVLGDGDEERALTNVTQWDRAIRQLFCVSGDSLPNPRVEEAKPDCVSENSPPNPKAGETKPTCVSKNSPPSQKVEDSKTSSPKEKAEDAEDPSQFVCKVTVEDFRDRSDLIKLLEEKNFPARKLRGKFFTNCQQRKIAEEFLRNSVEMAVNTPSYDFYLQAKTRMAAY